MVDQESILIRDLTGDELQLVGAGVIEGASLWSWVKVAVLQTLADQGPVGAFLAAAANAYFD
jgi:hypothetical protein